MYMVTHSQNLFSIPEVYLVYPLPPEELWESRKELLKQRTNVCSCMELLYSMRGAAELKIPLNDHVRYVYGK